MKKSFSEEVYYKISIQDLILVCFRINSSEKISFEKLLKQCFKLFPKKFGFQEYSKWPDARKLDRPLRTLRKRKLIAGNPQKSFYLTKNGRKKALEAINFLRQKKLKLK